MAIKIYTKTGDQGTTSLVTGQRVLKSSLRIEAYGALDEFNAVVGLLMCELNEAAKDPFTQEVGWLAKIQADVFAIGSELSCFAGKVPNSLKNLLIQSEDVALLENQIDLLWQDLPVLTNFVLPGGVKANALAHLARTICRRAERICVRLGEEDELRPVLVTYLNRLSDWLFALGRSVSKRLNAEEVLWVPRKK